MTAKRIQFAFWILPVFAVAAPCLNAERLAVHTYTGADGLAGDQVTCIARQLADHVYFVTGKNRPSRAFLSPNRGSAWFEVTGDLAETLDNVSFWSLVAHPFDHSQLFLATETGVHRTDGGLHWYRYMDGPPEVVKARGLEIHATTPDDAHLVLATWVHGVWEKDVEFQDYIFYDGFENNSTSRWTATVGEVP